MEYKEREKYRPVVIKFISVLMKLVAQVASLTLGFITIMFPPTDGYEITGLSETA